MSEHTVWQNCEHCAAEYEVTVTLTAEGCGESYDSWTGWSPAEGPEWDVTGPEKCEECGHRVDTEDNRERAIESATQAEADNRPRRRRR